MNTQIFHLTSKVIQGHKSSSNFSVCVRTVKCFFISIRHNFFLKLSMILKVKWGYVYVILKNFKSFDQIITLTYVLMDNFCFCYVIFLPLIRVWRLLLYFRRLLRIDFFFFKRLLCNNSVDFEAFKYVYYPNRKKERELSW